MPGAEVLCEPSIPLLLPNSDTAAGPIYLTRNAVTRDIERLEVATDAKTGVLSGKRVVVLREHYMGLCALGHSVAILPTSAGIKASMNRPKGYVPQSSTLPGSFSIAMYYGYVIGNFWVAGTMPAQHNAHILDYTVYTNNFQNVTANGHMVASVMTVSDSDFVNDFDGKGMWFSRGGNYCPSLATVPVSVAETWAIPSVSPPQTSYVTTWGELTDPNTCAAMSYGISYRFLVGANRSQQSVYYRYYAGDASPHYISPVVDSTNPAFRNGGAGVAFFVGGAEEGPYWYLQFNNVSARTQP